MSSDDDFFDEDKSNSKKEESSGLMPIVELPSDAGSESQASTARSDATTITNGNDSEDPDETPRSGQE